eukprot:GHVH01008926.1.p1 GENE.GHVH01008926.1~~GHVH01008926.1.p1  ORF type:complete len:1704 (-),score=242.43 GHVH01008926.1:566-5677(-)
MTTAMQPDRSPPNSFTTPSHLVSPSHGSTSSSIATEETESSSAILKPLPFEAFPVGHRSFIGSYLPSHELYQGTCGVVDCSFEDSMLSSLVHESVPVEVQGAPSDAFVIASPTDDSGGDPPPRENQRAVGRAHTVPLAPRSPPDGFPSPPLHSPMTAAFTMNPSFYQASFGQLPHSPMSVAPPLVPLRPDLAVFSPACRSNSSSPTHGTISDFIYRQQVWGLEALDPSFTGDSPAMFARPSVEDQGPPLLIFDLDPLCIRDPMSLPGWGLFLGARWTEGLAALQRIERSSQPSLHEKSLFWFLFKFVERLLATYPYISHAGAHLMVTGSFSCDLATRGSDMDFVVLCPESIKLPMAALPWPFSPCLMVTKIDDLIKVLSQVLGWIKSDVNNEYIEYSNNSQQYVVQNIKEYLMKNMKSQYLAMRYFFGDLAVAHLVQEAYPEYVTYTYESDKSHNEIIRLYKAQVPLLSLKSTWGVNADFTINTMNSVKHTWYFKYLSQLHGPWGNLVMRLVKIWVHTKSLPPMIEGGVPSIAWMIICSAIVGDGVKPNFGGLADLEVNRSSPQRPAIIHPPTDTRNDRFLPNYSPQHVMPPWQASYWQIGALFRFYSFIVLHAGVGIDIACTPRPTVAPAKANMIRSMSMNGVCSRSHRSFCHLSSSTSANALVDKGIHTFSDSGEPSTIPSSLDDVVYQSFFQLPSGNAINRLKGMTLEDQTDHLLLSMQSSSAWQAATEVLQSQKCYGGTWYPFLNISDPSSVNDESWQTEYIHKLASSIDYSLFPLIKGLESEISIGSELIRCRISTACWLTTVAEAVYGRNVVSDYLRHRHSHLSPDECFNQLFKEPVEFDDVTPRRAALAWGGMDGAHARRYTIPRQSISSCLVTSSSTPVSDEGHQVDERTTTSIAGTPLIVRFLPSTTDSGILKSAVQKFCIVVGNGQYRQVDSAATPASPGKPIIKYTVGGYISNMMEPRSANYSEDHSSSHEYSSSVPPPVSSPSGTSTLRPLSCANVSHFSVPLSTYTARNCPGDKGCESPTVIELPKLQPLKSGTFALVLVGGSLHIAHAKKLCCNHLNWWVHSSLSRRDFHSAFHSHVYSLVASSVGAKRCSTGSEQNAEVIDQSYLLFTHDEDVVPLDAQLELDDSNGILILPLQQTIVNQAPVEARKRGHIMKGLSRSKYHKDVAPCADLHAEEFAVNPTLERSIFPPPPVLKGAVPTPLQSKSKPYSIPVHPCHFVARVHVGVRVWKKRERTGTFSTLHLMPGEGGRLAHYASAVRLLPLQWHLGSLKIGGAGCIAAKLNQDAADQKLLELIRNIEFVDTDEISKTIDTKTIYPRPPLLYPPTTDPLVGMVGGELIDRAALSGGGLQRKFSALCSALIGDRLEGVPAVLPKAPAPLGLLLADQFADRLVQRQTQTHRSSTEERVLGLLKNERERRMAMRTDRVEEGPSAERGRYTASFSHSDVLPHRRDTDSTYTAQWDRKGEGCNFDGYEWKTATTITNAIEQTNFTRWMISRSSSGLMVDAKPEGEQTNWKAIPKECDAIESLKASATMNEFNRTTLEEEIDSNSSRGLNSYQDDFIETNVEGVNIETNVEGVNIETIRGDKRDSLILEASTASSDTSTEFCSDEKTSTMRSIATLPLQDRRMMIDGSNFIPFKEESEYLLPREVPRLKELYSMQPTMSHCPLCDSTGNSPLCSRDLLFGSIHIA